MGINPKIGITGLPRSGKSAVLQKVVDMISAEGSGFRRTRGPSPPEHVVGGMRCERESGTPASTSSLVRRE